MFEERVNKNREVWEDWTHLHLDTESDYQKEIQAFEAGESTLSEIVLEEVGDVQDKALLHLMCHFGLDTLSWAKHGARVTGIDFSSASIAAAKNLASTHGINAEFVCVDVYDLPESFLRQFDVVYAEGGILMWLPDIHNFAKVVARCLKPGGLFYLRDSHPFRRVIFPLVMDGHGELRQYHYFSQEPIRVDMRGSYAQPLSDAYHSVYFWVHGIGEIITALSAVGLRIEFLHEFPKVYENFPTTLQANRGQFEQHILHNFAIPDTFSIRATLITSS